MDKLDFMKKLKKSNIDYQAFESHLQEGQSVLDYQAGFGRDSRYFNANYDVTALNIDASLAADLSKDVQKSFCVDVREASFMNRFNGIWVFESFKDHSKELVKEILDSMYIALKKDGIIQVNLTADKIQELDFDAMVVDCHYKLLEKVEVPRTNLVNPENNYRFIIQRGSLLNK